MSHVSRIEMKLEAVKLCNMLEAYQRIYMVHPDETLRQRKEKEFDDRRADFLIQYNTDFVDVVEKMRAR